MQKKKSEYPYQFATKYVRLGTDDDDAESHLSGLQATVASQDDALGIFLEGVGNDNKTSQGCV